MKPSLNDPINRPQALAECLKQWTTWGAVVEHYLFPTPNTPTIEEHFVAACSGLVKAAHYGLQPKSRWELQFHWDALSPEVGEWKTPQQFFGWQLDVQERMLYLRGKEDCSQYFAADDVLETNGQYEWRIHPELHCEESIGYAHECSNLPIRST